MGSIESCLVRTFWFMVSHLLLCPHMAENGNVEETSTRETKYHTRRVGVHRFITQVGPEELTLQALSHKQRAYRAFIDRLWWATLAVNRLVLTKGFRAPRNSGQDGEGDV